MNRVLLGASANLVLPIQKNICRKISFTGKSITCYTNQLRLQLVALKFYFDTGKKTQFTDTLLRVECFRLLIYLKLKTNHFVRKFGSIQQKLSILERNSDDGISPHRTQPFHFTSTRIVESKNQNSSVVKNKSAWGYGCAIRWVGCRHLYGNFNTIRKLRKTNADEWRQHILIFWVRLN